MVTKRKRVHLVVQRKGGVGKSFISFMLAEYFLSKTKNESNVFLVDTDPTTHSFVNHQGLKVSYTDLIDSDDKTVNFGRFDEIYNNIVNQNAKNTVIDTGASNYLQIVKFLTEGSAELLHENGFDIIIHVPITGKDTKQECLDCFVELASTFSGTPYVNFVIWLNNLIKSEQKVFKGGNDIIDNIYEYKTFKNKVLAIINTPLITFETFGKALSLLMSNHLTFDEIKDLNELQISETETVLIDQLTKFRLKKIQSLYNQLIDEAFSSIDAQSVGNF